MSGGYVTLLGKLGKLDAVSPTKSYEKGAPFRCAHCYEHKEDHVVVDDKVTCLFAPAQFQSMDPAEYKAWYDHLPENRWLEVGAAGAEYIRDAMSKTSFASQVMNVYQMTQEELDQTREDKNKEKP